MEFRANCRSGGESYKCRSRDFINIVGGGRGAGDHAHAEVEMRAAR